MINVTKTFLPSFDDYTNTLKRAWDKGWITNNGELSLELEEKLKAYLGVRNFLLYNNGTTVLQMALKVLNVTKEVITTPFSYVATTTAILWEKCKPVFVDIDTKTFCIDPSKIESAITPYTEAILATHVYGYPCDVHGIETIAKKYNLRVIYDAAHAFGTKLKGKSLLNFGDISTCSFHATKVFHTGEGGCIVTDSDEWTKKLYLFRHFGHIGDEHFSMGINGKNSEFHAAMGLCMLNHIDRILEKRKADWLYYYSRLKKANVQLLSVSDDVEFNYAYFPLVFPTEAILNRTMKVLAAKMIFARRYFYPALNTLSYVEYQLCPVAEDIARRVICVPLFFDLTKEVQDVVAETVLEEVSR